MGMTLEFYRETAVDEKMPGVVNIVLNHHDDIIKLAATETLNTIPGIT